MENERRIFERFSAQFPAKFKDNRNEFGTDVYLRDASVSGARISSRERLYPNDEVALQVEVPDGGDPMLLQGRVKWSIAGQEPMWDIGVEFLEPNFMKMQRLFKFTLQS